MRRLISHLGIILLALFISGWGNVLAIACCPHNLTNQQKATTVGQSCHDVKSTNAGTKDSISDHHATHGSTTEPAATAGPNEYDAALDRNAGTCTHCIGDGDLPATQGSVREFVLQKRGSDKLIAQSTPLSAEPVGFTISRFVPTQHAPPGSAGDKHLLLSVFRI